MDLADIARLKERLHRKINCGAYAGEQITTDPIDLHNLLTLAERYLRHEQLGSLKATSPLSDLRAAFLRGEKVEMRCPPGGNLLPFDWMQVVTIHSFDRQGYEFRLALPPKMDDLGKELYTKDMAEAEQITEIKGAFLRGEMVEGRSTNPTYWGGWEIVHNLHDFDAPACEFRIVRIIPESENVCQHDDQITARDTFAIAALPALVAKLYDDSTVTKDNVAEDAYAYADSMLKARTKPIS